MTEGYVPEEFCDETTPPPRETPDAWIVEIGGDFYLDASDDPNLDEETERFALVNGQPYRFERLEEFGEATLTIGDDGSYSVDRDMPPGADQLYVPCDPETLSGSIAELVKNCGGDLGPGEHVVSYFTYHEEVWSFDAASKSFLRGAA